MSTRTALACGTALSLVAAGAWSYAASLITGPVAAVHLDRNMPADYARLADGPTGNGWELFTVVAVIYALCLLVNGMWQHRQSSGGGE